MELKKEKVKKVFEPFINDPIRQAFQNQILRLHQVGMYMMFLDVYGLKIILESPYKEMADEIQNKLSEYEKDKYGI